MSPSQRIEAAAQRIAPHSTAVDILAVSFAKVLADPHSEKYRKVSLSNPTMKRVAEQTGAMELLHAAGWEHHYGHLLLNVYERPLLQEAVAALQRVQTTSPAYARDRAHVQQELARSRATAQQEREDTERRQLHFAKVPAEPPEGSAGAAKICIHLADNSLVWRRFDSTVDTLRDLLNFVKSLKGAPDSPRLENVTQLPARGLDAQNQLGLSLHHLDLWPAGHVRVSCAA
uniref:UBX domain-containing protein n=1 Tax=Prymnesium polylepis TaxID=72548 RepID=A0A7S4MQG3_9EUKA